MLPDRPRVLGMKSLLSISTSEGFCAYRRLVVLKLKIEHKAYIKKISIGLYPFLF
jgi:hypothetical protein